MLVPSAGQKVVLRKLTSTLLWSLSHTHNAAVPLSRMAQGLPSNQPKLGQVPPKHDRPSDRPGPEWWGPLWLDGFGAAVLVGVLAPEGGRRVKPPTGSGGKWRIWKGRPEVSVDLRLKQYTRRSSFIHRGRNMTICQSPSERSIFLAID